MADTGVPFLDSILGSLAEWADWFGGGGGAADALSQLRPFGPPVSPFETGTLTQLPGSPVDVVPPVAPPPRSAPAPIFGSASPSPAPIPRQPRRAPRRRPPKRAVPRRRPSIPRPVRPRAPSIPKKIPIPRLPSLPGGINPIGFIIEEWRRYLDAFYRPTPGGGPRRGGKRTRLPPPAPPALPAPVQIPMDMSVLGDFNVRRPETLDEYIDRVDNSIFDARRNRMLDVGVDPSTLYSAVPYEVFRQPGLDPTPNARPRTFEGSGLLPSPAVPSMFTLDPYRLLQRQRQPSRLRQPRPREQTNLRELRNLTPPKNPALGLQPQQLGNITIAEPTSDPCAVRARDARRRQRAKRKKCQKFVYKRIRVCQSSNAK